MLVIVTNGHCNNMCLDLVSKISKITRDYYLTDTVKDRNAKDYLDDIKYDGEYPILFYKGKFISDYRNDPELASILKGL